MGVITAPMMGSCLIRRSVSAKLVLMGITKKDYEHEKAGYLHEAADRTHIITCHIENALGEHLAVKYNEDISIAYNKALDAAADLYQLIGTKL